MESTGSRLKKLRLEKGLTLEDVQKKTKIHLNILRAIEEDSLINFNPVYIKGFLKIYCRFLNVDPRDYMPDYKGPQDTTRYVSAAPSVSTGRKPVFGVSLLKSLSLKIMQIIKPKVIFVIALIFVFVIGLFNLGKIITSKRISVKKKLPIPVSVAYKPQGPALVKIIRLDISAKENCFIQVKSDGRVIFQNILRKGRSESWQAENKIELSVGNAGAVELEVNGSRLPPLGKRGQPLKNILITKEGLSIKR